MDLFRNALTYDPNGNIETLRRFDGVGTRIHNFTYQYEYEIPQTPEVIRNNQLATIPGYSSYEYNEIGQLTEEDKETGEDQFIDYDVSGKVIAVYSNSNKTAADLKVKYTYDDRGFRLAKTNFETKRTTWYIRDASGNVISIHETDHQSAATNTTEIPIYGSGKLGTYYPLSAVGSTEVGQPSQLGFTSYELTDHLGNVRAIVQDRITTFTATMEDNDAEALSNPRVQEMQYFQNLFETDVEDVNMNHSPSIPTVVDPAKRAAYLFWNDNAGTQASDKSIGPSITLRVDPGDELTPGGVCTL